MNELLMKIVYEKKRYDELTHPRDINFVKSLAKKLLPLKDEIIACKEGNIFITQLGHIINDSFPVELDRKMKLLYR